MLILSSARLTMQSGNRTFIYFYFFFAVHKCFFYVISRWWIGKKCKNIRRKRRKSREQRNSSVRNSWRSSMGLRALIVSQIVEHLILFFLLLLLLILFIYYLFFLNVQPFIVNFLCTNATDQKYLKQEFLSNIFYIFLRQTQS